ncbi:hypothetical protein Pelo_9296 [Pelomyxa schiedti]|nr:hypothetical protein Pelo_9296 [Pelomyxa schiedti]
MQGAARSGGDVISLHGKCLRIWRDEEAHVRPMLVKLTAERRANLPKWSSFVEVYERAAVFLMRMECPRVLDLLGRSHERGGSSEVEPCKEEIDYIMTAFTAIFDVAILEDSREAVGDMQDVYLKEEWFVNKQWLDHFNDLLSRMSSGQVHLEPLNTFLDGPYPSPPLRYAKEETLSYIHGNSRDRITIAPDYTPWDEIFTVTEIVRKRAAPPPKQEATESPISTDSKRRRCGLM